MKLLCIFVDLVLAVMAGYHEEVGIPLAARIKEYEERMAEEIPDMESRIVGGKPAEVGTVPYLVGLLVTLKDGGSMSVCGSSLVSASHLVTAAHCVDMAGYLEAVLGSQQLFFGGTRIRTNSFYAHPQFSRETLNYDIAVVSLQKSVKFTELIQPVSLPKGSEDYPVEGEWGVAAGYGITSDFDKGVKVTAVQNEIRLKVISNEVCSKVYNTTRSFEKICTDGAGGVGTCGGDSGGPFVINRNRGKVLAGVTSFGAKLCEINLPSVFTQVASFYDFIKEHMK